MTKTRDELEAMTKDELVNYADDMDIEVHHHWVKDEIIKEILKGQKAAAKSDPAKPAVAAAPKNVANQGVKTMTDFVARIRVTHPVEIVEVAAETREQAIAQLVEEHTAAGDSVEVMTVVEKESVVGEGGATGATGASGPTGTY